VPLVAVTGIDPILAVGEGITVVPVEEPVPVAEVVKVVPLVTVIV